MEHDEVHNLEFCEKSISSEVLTSLISIRPMSKCKTIYFSGMIEHVKRHYSIGSFISANDKVYLLLVSRTIKQYLHFCLCLCLNQSGPSVSSIIDQVNGDIFNKSNVPTPNQYIYSVGRVYCVCAHF